MDRGEATDAAHSKTTVVILTVWGRGRPPAASPAFCLFLSRREHREDVSTQRLPVDARNRQTGCFRDPRLPGPYTGGLQNALAPSYMAGRSANDGPTQRCAIHRDGTNGCRGRSMYGI